MQAILLILLTCLLTSCLSATREREANCLAATIMDVWQTEHELTSAEQVWRTAQQARSERTAQSRGSSGLSIRVADAFPIIGETAARFDSFGFPASGSQDDARLYQRMIDARVSHGQASKWYGLVARRVQTRIEEDEMLYPVLGMLATSMTIVLYPLVRWNVRSVLWDGADPDADDDPVQRFCAARVEERHRSLVLGGVVAGLGRRFGIAPWPARLLFVLLLMVVPGSQILVYPILWILMPSEHVATTPAYHGQNPTLAS